MHELNGKHILLVAPRFFNYEQEIIAELEALGATVDFLPDRPFKSPFLKAVTRLCREVTFPYADRFFLEQIELFQRRNYDSIFIVQGEGVSPRVLRFLQSAYPRARRILYMWDSFRNKKSLLSHLPFFERAFTFDPDDAKKYTMQFRPLFFSHRMGRQREMPVTYDLSFVGTVHSDRYAVVSNVVSKLPPKVRTYLYHYIQSRWMYRARRFTDPQFFCTRSSDFHFVPLSLDQVEEVFFSSRAIIDVEHPSQVGATMRTIEALGARKKLISTNVRLRDYDFYSPDNILIIDRKHVQPIAEQFFTSAYHPLPAHVYNRYSSRNWLLECLG